MQSVQNVWTQIVENQGKFILRHSSNWRDGMMLLLNLL